MPSEGLKVNRKLKSVTLNGIMALILHYFTEFGSFRVSLRKSG